MKFRSSNATVALVQDYLRSIDWENFVEDSRGALRHTKGYDWCPLAVRASSTRDYTNKAANATKISWDWLAANVWTAADNTMSDYNPVAKQLRRWMKDQIRKAKKKQQPRLAL